jgi:hypothetical protein
VDASEKAFVFIHLLTDTYMNDHILSVAQIMAETSRISLLAHEFAAQAKHTQCLVIREFYRRSS